MRRERQRIVLRDGCRVNVVVTGAGPELILLHGFSGSALGWGRAVDGLSRRHRLVLVDLLGHGLSDKPRHAERYRMEEVVADVEEVVRRFRPPVDLLGYSMGGRVALATALSTPELVRRLVLESASPGLSTMEERAVRVASDEALADRISRGGIDAFLEAWRGLPLFRSLETALSPEGLGRLEAQRASNDPSALAAVLRGLGTGRQPSLWASLPSLTRPTLLLTGRRDSKFTALAESMVACLPHAR
ncbi:MAG: 2-succinyl-6-hydroxy-2,4-cyclohexadiene-1-carboxylate synthase, partial [Gemmatimonadetes bacterium]|nr:2-succinyl-6-hydroxy-2,4-cyclohexadiene-1-carboxylate synthase [Gemmatimonadota bacterium]